MVTAGNANPPKSLTLGYSSCPNDTFTFHALVSGAVDGNGLKFSERLQDVEALNDLARRGAIDVSKVSYGVIPFLLRDYALLRSGGALGRGCGPLLVARSSLRPQELRGKRIAIPGRCTTANLLLRLFDPALPPGEPRVYSEIMPAVQRGEVDAGLIIHESRFTYPRHGLMKVIDLGDWWESTTGLPIPLGGIVARRSLGEKTIRQIDSAVRRSVEYALEHPSASQSYVLAHAQEMDEAVASAHIKLYVNDFSRDIGPEGERAVAELFARARDAGIIPTDEKSPFPSSRT